MKNQENRWILIVCMVLGVLLTTACEKPPKKESAKPSPPVVSRAMPQQADPKTTAPEKTPSQKPPLPAQNQPASDTHTDTAPGLANLSINADNADRNGGKKDLAQVSEASEIQADTDIQTGVLKPADSEVYVAKSMIDPFKPLIQEKKETPVPEIEKPEKPQRILTPLEKMELSQIKLVAVVIMGDRKIAMVEEATGKGYEVGMGTYMGKNGGQVVDITFDTIVVKEIVTDYKGNEVERLQEIKIQKNDSGE